MRRITSASRYQTISSDLATGRLLQSHMMHQTNGFSGTCAWLIILSCICRAASIGTEHFAGKLLIKRLVTGRVVFPPYPIWFLWQMSFSKMSRSTASTREAVSTFQICIVIYHFLNPFSSHLIIQLWTWTHCSRGTIQR